MIKPRTTARRWALSAVAGAIALSIAPGETKAQTTVTSGDTVEVVVDFDDGIAVGRAREIARNYGVTLRPNSQMASEDGIFVAVVPRDRVHAVLRSLERESAVEAAEENITMRALFTPNDPLYERQWGLRRVGSEAAWDVTCGRGVVVAVVDTGVACENHGEFTRVPDLEGARCLPGWNFVSGDAHANDDQGHGTHVAGTIAQTTHNGLGGAGVAYCASIMPVKVLDANGRGSLANVAEGIRWAADHGADVINLSLGGGGRSKVMEQAVAYARSKGVTVVCAAGNNGRYVESPANAPGAVAVSAIDDGDQIAFFSSRGPEVDLAAPGVQILQQTICNHGRDRCEQFASWSGTSMAAPHVAGVAALVHSLGVTDPDAVEAALKQYTSRPAHGATDVELYGAGIVSASEVTRGVLQEQGYTRLAMLGLVALALGFWIRRRRGSFGFEGLLPAYLTGVGLFFLPTVLPRQTPGVDLLMRPLAGWDLILLGSTAHRWLLFANAGVVMLLVGVGFGRRWLRGTIGGVAAGVSAYLLAEVYLGAAFAPLGRAFYLAWALSNAALCLWVARIGLDRKTAN